jgi:hypothetical protein
MASSVGVDPAKTLTEESPDLAYKKSAEQVVANFLWRPPKRECVPGNIPGAASREPHTADSFGELHDLLSFP